MCACLEGLVAPVVRARAEAEAVWERLLWYVLPFVASVEVVLEGGTGCLLQVVAEGRVSALASRYQALELGLGGELVLREFPLALRYGAWRRRPRGLSLLAHGRLRLWRDLVLVTARVEVDILLLLLGALVGGLAVFGRHGGLVLLASTAQITR